MSNTDIQIKARQDAIKLYEKAGIVLTDEEKNRLEFCDYGLNDFERIGTEILIYVNTKRVCAKEMALTPNQICPEHIHPQLGDYAGKEETFRCRWGEVYLYVPGEPTKNPKGFVPQERKEHFTVWHEIHLLPGEQYTLKEQTLHWFQAGPEGAVISEFSTPSFDEADIFTDPQINRVGLFSIN
ncbi:MAG: D-lyxose/D-mannose family sugar isomerase [Clostridia bacterium]|nr:D-lyxose/D-mannose family sugar isomerase [Clostridia bacterium]